MILELRLDAKTKRRFWTKVKKGGFDECWEWQAHRHEHGYGRFSYLGKYMMAHIFSYEMHFGRIEKGLKVLHECDNPPCVNPNHLFTGTMADNIRDRDSKHRTAVGDKHGKSKITVEQCQLLIEIHNKSDLTQKEIGDIFGLSKSQVSHILTGRCRRYLNASTLRTQTG